MDNFCVFILTHGRPSRVKTYTTLRNHGYSGRIILVIDNEDPTAAEYYRHYGEQVVMFDKQQIATTFDTGDNFDNRKTIVYARNACWKIAEERNIEAFVQLDDDYYWFGYRTAAGAKSTRRLDTLFALLVTFLYETPVTSVAFSQGATILGVTMTQNGFRVRL